MYLSSSNLTFYYLLHVSQFSNSFNSRKTATCQKSAMRRRRRRAGRARRRRGTSLSLPESGRGWDGNELQQTCANLPDPCSSNILNYFPVLVSNLGNPDSFSVQNFKKSNLSLSQTLKSHLLPFVPAPKNIRPSQFFIFSADTAHVEFFGLSLHEKLLKEKIGVIGYFSKKERTGIEKSQIKNLGRGKAKSSCAWLFDSILRKKRN